MPDDLKVQLNALSSEARAIATDLQTGNTYDQEKAANLRRLAHHLGTLAARKHAQTTNVIPFEPAYHYAQDLPGTDVEAFVQNADGEVLLIQRRDSAWALPGGVAEIGLMLAECAIKELYEEAGLRGEVVRPLGWFYNHRWPTDTDLHVLIAVFLVRCIDLSLAVGSECLDSGFFPVDALPTPMHIGHAQRVPVCYNMAQSGRTYFDPPS